ncbi:MAG: exodeoxyribonuclease VII small subunit [Candidatus Protistobacter heckmanni]|nr:exodeoxyribonuclease VII small subunit [Candidatus Protistobacter heckmanni]
MAKSASSNKSDLSAEPLEQTADSYEAAMEELETLIGRMEGCELTLEDSLAAYQRGSVLVKYCQQVLEKVEQQVRMLETQAGGEARLAPLAGDKEAGGEADR